MKALLVDRVGGSNTEAYTSSMAYGLDMVENGVDDFEELGLPGRSLLRWLQGGARSQGVRRN